jgi:hypothetical protein
MLKAVQISLKSEAGSDSQIQLVRMPDGGIQGAIFHTREDSNMGDSEDCQEFPNALGAGSLT